MNLRTSVFIGDAPLVDILVSQMLPRAANTFLLGIPRRWRGDRMCRLTVYVLASGILMVSYDGLKLQWQYLFRTVVVMSTFPSLKHVLLPVVLSGWCVLLCCQQRDTRMQLRTHVRCDVVVRRSKRRCVGMLLLIPESVPHGAGTRRCVDLWTIENKRVATFATLSATFATLFARGRSVCGL